MLYLIQVGKKHTIKHSCVIQFKTYPVFRLTKNTCMVDSMVEMIK